MTERHCKTGVLARCPLGRAGEDARANFRLSNILVSGAGFATIFYVDTTPPMAVLGFYWLYGCEAPRLYPGQDRANA